LQRVFVLDSERDQIIFEHASLSLQEFAEGFKADSRISEALLFVSWKTFENKSLSAKGYLLCFREALSLDSKWSADICDKLVCCSADSLKQIMVFQSCSRIYLVSRRKSECKFVIANGWLLRRSKVFVTVKK
jgi:hypothetical protein